MSDDHFTTYPAAPPEKPASEYSYAERRGELKRMLETDSLDDVTTLAVRYDVSESVIQRDLQVVEQHVR